MKDEIRIFKLKNKKQIRNKRKKMIIQEVINDTRNTNIFSK